MIRTKLARVSLAAVLAASISVPAFAGGALEQIDFTGDVPSPLPGQLTVQLVRIFWDSRCVPVNYLMNNTQDPIQNPLGAPVITLADATTAINKAMNSWNKIPTSYIHMQIFGTVANPGPRGFDMKNELTFNTPGAFGAIASSPSVSLVESVTFLNNDDLDDDGDVDVLDTLTQCQDVDNDGDIEFPAGFYQAGTILENDVQFNVKAGNGFRFTTADAAADITARSVDLEAVAVHELGHSHGLSHVADNNKSKTNGDGTTMFPFVDTTDPAAELQARSLGSDDIAWSSYFYPEGTASSGPAALQAGDFPFNLAYGLIKGSVTHGVLNEPVVGASVAAFNLLNGEFQASGFSGKVQLSFDPATGGLFVIDSAYNVVHGDYTIPVPLGLWKVNLEALDGNPVPAANVSLSAQVGDILGQLDFNEELWNGPGESATEPRPGFALPVGTVPFLTTSGINFVTNQQINLENFGTRDFVGFTGSPGGFYYAVRFPASQLTAINPGGDILLQAGTFDTILADASVVPMFAEAILTTGTVTGTTATINLANPLVKETRFLGADNDFAPFYFPLPETLSRHVQKKIEKGEITNLFLVLRLPPAPFPGVSALPPFIGLDGGIPGNDVPIFGLSYLSPDGVTFNQVADFNFRFQLLARPD